MEAARSTLDSLERELGHHLAQTIYDRFSPNSQAFIVLK